MYPLGPPPWALADQYDFLRNQEVFTGADPRETSTSHHQFPANTTSTYDGIAVFQQFKPPPGLTFGIVAEELFDLITSNSSKRYGV